VIVALVVELTGFVLIANVAEALPAGIVMVAATVTELALLERETFSPPEGAGPLKTSLPVEDLPPTTLEGLTVSKTNAGGLIVSVAVCEAPSRLADISKVPGA